MSSRYRGQEDVDSRVQVAREEYQKVHGEAPPVNPGEASNGFVRVGDSHVTAGNKSWRDYEGVKSVDLEGLSYRDLVADSEHTYDEDNEWQIYDPSEPFADNETVGHAVDVFDRMAEDVNDLLEPKAVTDGGKDVEYSENQETMEDVRHTHTDYDAPL